MTGYDDHGVLAPQPRKRFPEFDGTGDWVERKIGDFLTESREKGSKGDVATKLTVKLWGKGVFEKAEALTGSANTQYYRRSAGQFIYSKLDFLNQAFGIIPEALDGFESTIDLPCFAIKPGLNPTFLLEYVQRESFYKKNGEVADGGRKAKRIQPEVFFEMPIIIPPRLEEQDAIAEAILSIDALIQAETEKLDSLKNHKQGLMQQLFPAEGESHPALRFPEFVEHDGWAFRELGPMTDKVGSGVTPKGGDANYKTSGRPFLRSQNVGWGLLILEDVAHIDEETHQNMIGTELIKGDVLLNITGASIGRSAIADSRVEGGNVNQHVCIIRAKPEELNPKFVKQYLLSSFGQSQIDQCQAGGNRQGLNFQQIRSFNIPLPPTLDEQRIIASALQSADEFLSERASRLETLKNHKQGLLQQLFPVLDEVDG